MSFDLGFQFFRAFAVAIVCDMPRWIKHWKICAHFLLPKDQRRADQHAQRNADHGGEPYRYTYAATGKPGKLVEIGDTKVIFQAPSVQMMEFIKQGKLKVIGVTSAQPSPAVPGAVPLNKFVPGYVQDINFALWAPPGTPADVAAKLTETVRKGLSAPGMAEKFVAFSVPLAVAGPDEVTRITTRESNNIKKIMETVPIKFE